MAATTTPEATLSRAVAAINAGHHQKGARLAYQAAWDALSRKAASHGRALVDDDDAIVFTQWLDANNTAQPTIYDRNGQDLGRKLAVTSNFIVAMGFKDHAGQYPRQQQDNALDYWSPEDYHRYLPHVSELVQSVKDILPKDDN